MVVSTIAYPSTLVLSTYILCDSFNNLVGHYDVYVSEHAGRNLMEEVDHWISTKIAKNPNVLDNTILACLINTFEEFDTTLHRTLIERMRAMDDKPWNEWTLDDVPRFLGMKELGENDLIRSWDNPVLGRPLLLCLKGMIMVNKVCGLLPLGIVKEVSIYFYLSPKCSKRTQFLCWAGICWYNHLAQS